MGYRGFSKFLQGKASPEHSLLKLFGSESLQRALLFGVDAFGTDGRWTSTGSARGMWRRRCWIDLVPALLLAAPSPAGPVEIQRNIIAERVLGLPR